MNGARALAERLDYALARDKGGGFVESAGSLAANVLADGSVYLSAADAERYRAIEAVADCIVALNAAPLAEGGWLVDDADFAALRTALEGAPK